MYPVLFSINGIEIRALTVFLILGLLVFGINLWKNTREKKNLGFDLFGLNLIINPLVARIIYILLNMHEYEGFGWSFLPIRDSGEGVELFKTFPWVFFSFWEKGMNYQFLPLVLVISVFVLVLFRKEKLLELPLADIWKSFFMGFVIILFGFFLDGTYLSNVTDFPLALRYKGQAVDLLPIQLIEIVALLLGLILYLDSFKMLTRRLWDGFKVAFFPIYWAALQIGLWFVMAGFSKDFYIFDVAQLIWIGMIIILLFILSPLTKNLSWELTRRGKKQPAKQARLVRNIGTPSTGKDYNYSYSNYKKELKTRMNAKERLEQAKNRIKRGI